MTGDLFGNPTTQDLARDGMARAVDHADRVCENWSDEAGQLLRIYAQINLEFMSEDLRVWAHRKGNYILDSRNTFG
jgi:hypothetical protein